MVQSCLFLLIVLVKQTAEDHGAAYSGYFQTSSAEDACLDMAFRKGKKITILLKERLTFELRGRLL